ncbi:hypothetical protein MIR68_005722 [Amoeboaphelidium protococcarum]|nr:hypothetical protein MIR68_005722 [Amoeboaphelidium protococcarum]
MDLLEFIDVEHVKFLNVRDQDRARSVFKSLDQYNVFHNNELQIDNTQQTENGQCVCVSDTDTATFDEYDESIIMVVPFTQSVKIQSISLNTDPQRYPLNAPSRMVLFANKSVDFNDVESMWSPDNHVHNGQCGCTSQINSSGQVSQEFDLINPSSTGDRISYELLPFKFSNVTLLSIYFPWNFKTRQMMLNPQAANNVSEDIYGLATMIDFVGFTGTCNGPVNNLRVVKAVYETKPNVSDHPQVEVTNRMGM